MTRANFHGINLILVIAFFFTSCSTVKNIQNIQNAGVVLRESYSYYINDSLTFSYRFPGCCYQQIVNKLEIIENFQIVNKNLPLSNCIACFRDFGETSRPDYVHFAFYFPDKKNTNNKLLNAIKKSSTDFYTNESKFIVGKHFYLENDKGSIYMLGHISNFNMNGLSNSENDYHKFHILKLNYEDIFNSIKTSEQYRDISFSSPFDIGREWEVLEDTTVNYLMPAYQLKKSEPNYAANSSRWTWLQAYSTYHSRLTNEQKETYESELQSRNLPYLASRIVSSENVLQTNEAALNYLIQISKDERVVMINENHYMPHHRIFEEIILDSLYNYGFRYLAMEAIFENDAVLNSRGFATTHTGFYPREPMMANLIRKAIEKGYYVFGYDDFTSDREKNQVLNIYRKTIAEDSLSKVLVLAGFQHIDETEGTKNWMAREFFLLTGIDPLTINQQKFVTEDAFLMVLDTTTLKNRGVTCDIFVANNINYEFFATKSDYKDYNITIPAEIAEEVQTNPLYRDKPFLLMVSIFKADEYQKDKTAIPVYNHVLNNDLTDFSIKLPYSNYYYQIRNRYGDVLYSGSF